MALELERPRIFWRKCAAEDFPGGRGFAAETENVLENARKKLASKSLDAIVVTTFARGRCFDSDRNAVTISRTTKSSRSETRSGKLRTAC